MAAFWRFAKRHYRKEDHDTGTADNYKPVLAILKQRYGHTPAAQFGPRTLKAIRAVMIELGNCRRYVNDQSDRIKRVFKRAASEQLIPAGVPQSLTTVEGMSNSLLRTVPPTRATARAGDAGVAVAVSDRHKHHPAVEPRHLIENQLNLSPHSCLRWELCELCSRAYQLFQVTSLAKLVTGTVA